MYRGIHSFMKCDTHYYLHFHLYLFIYSKGILISMAYWFLHFPQMYLLLYFLAKCFLCILLHHAHEEAVMQCVA